MKKLAIIVSTLCFSISNIYAYETNVSQPTTAAKSTTTPAAPKDPRYNAFSDLHPVITITGGVNWTKTGQDQTYTELLMGVIPVTANFEADNSWQSNGLWGVFFGLEYSPYPCWAWQIGLGYYSFFSDFDVSGDYNWQNNIAHSYDYKISSTQVLIENKFFRTVYDRFHPYVSFGLGMGFNRSSGFQSTTFSDVSDSALFFADESNSSFSYNVGFGVEVDIIKHLRFGIGYRFADLGSATLGAGRSTNPAGDNLVDFTLKQSHLYSNQILAQLSWIF